MSSKGEFLFIWMFLLTYWKSKLLSKKQHSSFTKFPQRRNKKPNENNWRDNFSLMWVDINVTVCDKVMGNGELSGSTQEVHHRILHHYHLHHHPPHPVPLHALPALNNTPVRLFPLLLHTFIESMQVAALTGSPSSVLSAANYGGPLDQISSFSF